MRKFFMAIVALLCVFVISSCNSGALVFNNKIVEVQKVLEPKIAVFEAKMTAVGENGDIKKIVPDAKVIVEEIDKSIVKLKALEAPKDGEEFKRAMLVQYEFIKKLYGQVIVLGDASTTDEEKAKIVVDFTNAESDMQKLQDDTQAKQKVFAKANGFKLEFK
jgi:hypothetical protein